MGRPDKNNDKVVQEINKKAEIISRCLLFRVQDWGSLRGPTSGIALYTTFKGRRPPALVGFVSFEQKSRDEGLNQDIFDGKDMNDAKFSEAAGEGRVAFFGAWKLPLELTEGYEIV